MSTISQSKIRNFISILFSFFISLFIFAFSFIVIIQTTFFNFDFLYEQMQKSNYCENAIQEVEAEFVSYGSVSNFDADFFNTVIDLNQVKLDVYQTVLKLYSKSDTNVDTEKFKSSLYEKLKENVKSRNIEITGETEKSLTYLAETCTTTYEQYISIPFISEMAPVLNKLQMPLKLISYVLLGLILFLAVFIFMINRWKHRAVRYYIYSVSGSMLMLTALPLLAFASGKIQKISFMSKSLYYLAVSLMNNFFFMFFQFAIALFVLVLILSIIYYSMKKKVSN